MCCIADQPFNLTDSGGYFFYGGSIDAFPRDARDSLNQFRKGNIDRRDELLESLAGGTSAGAVEAVSVFREILSGLFGRLVQVEGVFTDFGVVEEVSAERVDIRQLRGNCPTVDRRQT